jgi:GT2 family glycosyltransferase
VNPGEIVADRAWKTVTLDLAAYSGKNVEVRLSTAVAPGAPTAYAWAVWGDPRLLVRRPAMTALRTELYRTRKRGVRTSLRKYRAQAAGQNGKTPSGYQLWLDRHFRDEIGLEWIRRDAERFQYRPTISLITPVYNTDPKWLRLLVASVKAQTYPRWELCLCNDGSSNPATLRELDALANDDPRIKVSHLPENRGISAASNGALATATGEFVGLLDHDDELTPDALYEVVNVLQSHPDADLIYSDEDKLEPDGRPSEPFFKPDWSPDYLRSTMYVGHFGVYRRTLVDTVGGFRSEFDGTQDYDLALRFSEHTDRVHHIPRILYRWRKIPGSTAGSVEAKPWGFDASFRALADHAARLDPPACAENTPGLGYARVRYRIVGEPLVSIIIPTDARIADTAAGPRDLLLTCVRSVVERTTYKNYELLIIDNGHLSAAAETYLAMVPHRRVTYRYDEPFNFAAKVNFAAHYARGEHLLLLNDDIEVIGEEWLSAMLEFSQQRDVGAVGAKLYFPDGRLQHIGVVIGIGGGACHIFSGEPKTHPGYFGAAKTIRDFSAVTGACMMTSRAAFDRIGGFDPTFLTDFNDVDYCLRLRALGYRIVYTPFAELHHYEGATFGSRERIVNPAEVQAFGDRWGAVIANDPYYNPNLTRSALTYGLRF